MRTAETTVDNLKAEIAELRLKLGRFDGVVNACRQLFRPGGSGLLGVRLALLDLEEIENRRVTLYQKPRKRKAGV